MLVACLDLEGVLIPEIWINVAARTGIDDLKATTRDVPDYDELMQFRLDVLARHGIGIADIQSVIAEMEPLDGARAFLESLRQRSQVIILSDTFYEFATPLMARLGWPTLFCHHLVIGDDGAVADYRLRIQDPKRKAVKALHGLNFRVIAAGDSYNDISMLSEADAGILFRPPQNVIDEFPQFPVTTDYAALANAFAEAELGVSKRSEPGTTTVASGSDYALQSASEAG
ncbi:MAG: bifunctional phosphoserine phosphatase/homoserine phosphotransferase ThrH [Rhodospirillaceae bacterium]|nr:bifunctional phosphoserine phosphatase/homoserine phosphotransferase ThrH [Rhodospirillaceae bacterium]